MVTIDYNPITMMLNHQLMAVTIDYNHDVQQV
jgi:hypothetical protein